MYVFVGWLVASLVFVGVPAALLYRKRGREAREWREAEKREQWRRSKIT